jgi:methionine-rich copper-binding protein CopC
MAFRRYAADGALRVRVVDGDTLTGQTAPDGAVNVSESDGTNRGLFAPGGSIRVTVADNTAAHSKYYAPDGSMYVTDVVDEPRGAQYVEVVSGSLFGPIIELSGPHEFAESLNIGGSVGALSVVGGSGVYTFTITVDTDNKFDLSGDDVITTDSFDYESDTSHSFTVEADNGVDDPFTEVFTITVTDVDEVAPTISSLSPADNATDVVVSTNFVMTFSEDIAAGATANFYLTKTSGGVLIETLTEADFGTKLVVSGDTLTINWTSNLDASTAYYVEWDAGSVTDLLSNPLAASSGSTQWNITTAAAGAEALPYFTIMFR